jgi:hypothetical protein
MAHKTKRIESPTPGSDAGLTPIRMFFSPKSSLRSNSKGDFLERVSWITSALPTTRELANYGLFLHTDATSANLISVLFFRHRALSCMGVAMNFLPSSKELLLFITAGLILLLVPGPAVLYVVARSGSGAQGRIGLVFWHRHRHTDTRAGCDAWPLGPAALFGSSLLVREVCGSRLPVLFRSQEIS